YDDRDTIYTISGVDAATNASTSGTQEYLGSPLSVWFNTGNNHDEGYVARWANIEPGPDGSFTVRAEAHPTTGDGVKAYAIDVFMLQEFPQCLEAADCDDGFFCTGIESCDTNGLCQSSGDPCGGGEWCEESGELCLPYGNGDLDFDGDVDLNDFAGFQKCFGHSALFGGCGPANLTGDGMIDLDDFAGFQEAFTGPLP
ncbi:MAG: hypothetical protein ACYSVY_11045, partial [Planctomycetota bacterium]